MFYWSNVKIHSCSSIAPSFLIFFLSLLSLIVCTLAFNIKPGRYSQVRFNNNGWIYKPFKSQEALWHSHSQNCINVDPGNDCRTCSKLIANLDNNSILYAYNFYNSQSTFPKLSHHILMITLGIKYYRHYFLIFLLFTEV